MAQHISRHRPMQFWNVYGRDCHGRLFFRGMIGGRTAREALNESKTVRPLAVGGHVVSLNILPVR